MDILFVHNRFPAQYEKIAAELAESSTNRVVAIGSAGAQDLPGVDLRRYDLPEQDVSRTHILARRFDNECRRAELVYYIARDLAASGFRPAIIMVHCGWGENLPLRAIFPNAKIIVNAEYYYNARGQDMNFDAEFGLTTPSEDIRLACKNATTLLALVDADLAIAATPWQRSTFPPALQAKIGVLHEGIDTREVAPDSSASLTLPSGRVLSYGDEVVTYVARDFEPVRGFHRLMRALPAIMKARPNAQFVLCGGDGVSYAQDPPEGSTWREHFMDEVGAELDLDRLHVLGFVDRPTFLAVLRVSAVHLYLSYPFILSWSVLEAMSAGCVVVAADTAPVRDVIDERCGVPVPFHDTDAIAGAVCRVLADPAGHAALRTHARERVVERYDAERVILPKLLRALECLERGSVAEALATFRNDPPQDVRRPAVAMPRLSRREVSGGDLHRRFLANAQGKMHKWFHYFDIYERHLSRFRGTAPVMIETGVGEGGSLAMWRDYFGEGCTIIGIDRDPACQRFEAPGIAIHIGSQDDPRLLAHILKSHPRIDIVLDDGSHRMEHMIASFDLFYPRLHADGVYIVEDTHTCYWPEYGGGLNAPGSFMRVVKDRLDALNAVHTRGAVAVSDFTRSTDAIVSYDSVVVFERRPQGRRQAAITGPM